MAGLGAGHYLHSQGVPFTCYDKNPYLGGHTASLRYPGGFVFDEGGHLSYTTHDHVKQLLADNVEGNFEERTLTIDNYWHGVRIPHPVQTSLRFLPSDLIVEVIADFAAISNQARPDPAEQNYEEWLRSTYGSTFAETFPMVYGTKYHTTTMDNLVTDWIGPRMYQPTLAEIVRGALPDPSRKPAHYVDVYRYPSRGGFQSYLEPFGDRFEILLGHRVTSIDPATKTLRFSNGAERPYTSLVSSIPLPDLVRLIQGAPTRVAEAAQKLAYTTAILFNIAVDRADLSPTAITYFYDEDIEFSRVNLPHMFSPNNAPPGCGLIQAEIYVSDKYRPLPGSPVDHYPQVIADLTRAGFLRESDTLLLQEIAVIKYANVIYDLDRADSVATVHRFLDDIGIRYCGRYGDWNHAWTDQAFVSGEEAARLALGSCP